MANNSPYSARVASLKRQIVSDVDQVAVGLVVPPPELGFGFQVMRHRSPSLFGRLRQVAALDSYRASCRKRSDISLWFSISASVIWISASFFPV